MSNELLKLISNTEAATHLKMKSGNFVVDDTIGISLLFSSFYKEKPGKYLLLTSNLYVAQKVSDFIASLIGEENVFLFPIDDMLRNETLTSSPLCNGGRIIHESFRQAQEDHSCRR